MSISSVALIPYYGPAPNAHHFAVRKAQVSVIRTESTGIDSARIVLLEQALRSSADVFVFIDSDVIFTSNDYARIALRTHKNLCVVSGDYALKNGSGASAHVIASVHPVGDLLRAERLGMGFTAISRPAALAVTAGLEKVWMPMAIGEAMLCAPAFLPMVHDGRYLKEDYAFCQRALDAGVGLFVDPAVRPIHVGESGFQRPPLLTPAP